MVDEKGSRAADQKNEPKAADSGKKLTDIGTDPDTTNLEVTEPGAGTVVTQHHLDVVEEAKRVLSEEAEYMDETDGPGDSASLDNSDDPAHDHVFSPDPFKKAFPPGPDDPTKL